VTLTIYTARISYGGADRLDVTARGYTPETKPFAPTWALLRPYLDKRKAGVLTESDWDEYAARYTREMRHTYSACREAWDALLARDVATLCCYCTHPTQCHRYVLARILVKLGAAYAGEREAKGTGT
jgi:uncharacterized protein YeaO (DUF488 family)